MTIKLSWKHMAWHWLGRPYIDYKDGIRYTAERVPEFWPKKGKP
ncbi:MAG: hypothetical protein Q8Q08_10415 [Candidatus Omnitrophota bacterium]|nr:hypothetical protein [Candidatus Omnitrophota bacterium]